MRDLRAELLRAEASHFAKKGDRKGISDSQDEQLRIEAAPATTKRGLESVSKDEDPSEPVEANDEDPEAKRRRLILEEAREIDADSERSESDSSDELVKEISSRQSLR